MLMPSTTLLLASSIIFFISNIDFLTNPILFLIVSETHSETFEHISWPRYDQWGSIFTGLSQRVGGLSLNSFERFSLAFLLPKITINVFEGFYSRSFVFAQLLNLSNTNLADTGSEHRRIISSWKL